MDRYRTNSLSEQGVGRFDTIVVATGSRPENSLEGRHL
jgi:hypothetical protein